jgi:hypothetical protein
MLGCDALEMKPYTFTPATTSASRNVIEARTVIASISEYQYARRNGFVAGSI